MSDANAPPAPDTTAPDALPRKTRKGETFLPPSDVQLHCTDFTFDEITTAHAEVLAGYREKLAALGMPPQAPPAGTKPPSPAVISGALLQEMLTAAPGTAPNHWERHYQANRSNFFPVKNYMLRAFPTLLPEGVTIEALGERAKGENGEEDGEAAGQEEGASSASSTAPPTSEGRRVIMEAGCGSGSVVLPLMKLFPGDAFICHDISATAVALLSSHAAAAAHKAAGLLSSFEQNIATADLPETIRAGQYLHTKDGAPATELAPSATQAAVLRPGCVDRLLLIFVLCALQPHEMPTALRRLARWLRPQTGELLFRDYGVLDHNLMRFMEKGNAEAAPGNLAFVKGDGTTQFFFEREWTVALFAEAGLTCRSFEYHCNRVVNRKDGRKMEKIFVNAVFYRDE